MTAPDRPAGDGDVFAERLLQIVDEGRRTATYKLALLLALIDACAAEADAVGVAPAVLHTRTVARHVLRLYLPQARQYLGATGDPLRLKQIASGRSALFASVLRLHLAADAARCRTLGEVERQLAGEYEACLDEVERTFARYPLRLLQVVGREHRPFLYDVDWSDSVSLKALHAVGGGLVRFRPDAGDRLLRLAPLVRPLIELHWARMVARLNGLATEDERLRVHLFGTERAVFPASLRGGLVELQHGCCFYCGNRLRSRIDVDHVIPWSRWPNDAVENLVVADSCNGRKSDYLPAMVHVDRWAQRLVTTASELSSLAADTRWTSDHHRSLSLARACYAHLPAGTPLWLLGDDFTDDDPTLIARHLATVTARTSRG